MELDEIKKHWDTNAKDNTTALCSTTKTATIKRLEINAFAGVISSLIRDDSPKCLLEVGCGNGYNLFGLEGLFPTIEFEGIDYSEVMIASANDIKNERTGSKIVFKVADFLNFNSKILASLGPILITFTIYNC